MKTTILVSSLLSLASARIVGFAAPKTVAPGTDIKIEILTEGFSQSVHDVATSFGIDSGGFFNLGALGNFLNTKVYRAEESNLITNITHTVRIPATQPKGETTVIQAAHFSLTGANLSPSIETYYVNVTVGDATSEEYSRSALTPKLS